MMSTRPRKASVASDHLSGSPECRCELRDLRAVDPRHLWMTTAAAAGQRRRSCSSSRRAAFSDSISSRTSDGATPRCSIRSRFISRVNSSQNLSKSPWFNSLSWSAFRTLAFNLVAPDGEAVAARALLASAEARQPVATGHDEPGTADAAFDSPEKKSGRLAKPGAVEQPHRRTKDPAPGNFHRSTTCCWRSRSARLNSTTPPTVMTQRSHCPVPGRLPSINGGTMHVISTPCAGFPSVAITWARVMLIVIVRHRAGTPEGLVADVLCFSSSATRV